MREKIVKQLENFLLFFVFLLLSFFIAEISIRIFYDEYSNFSNDARVEFKNKNGYYSKDYLVGNYIDKDGMLRESDTRDLIEKEYAYFDFNAIKKEKNSDVFRIAILGDSFTGGGGVNSDREKYTNQLKEMIKDIPGKKIEIIAFGNAGLNTEQEYVVFQEMLLEYDPDIFILQYCDNDIGPKRKEFGFAGSDIHIRTKTEILILEDKIVPTFSFLRRDINKLVLKSSAFARFFSYKLNIFMQNMENDIDKSLNYLEKMKNIATDKNIPMIMINFPVAEQESNACSDKKYVSLHKNLKNFAKEKDIYFYNMCDYFEDIRTIRSEYDNHYNAEGHKMAAQILYDAVKKNF